MSETMNLIGSKLYRNDLIIGWLLYKMYIFV